MQPIAILTSDLHIRSDQPACRTDDFMQTQKEKWMFIKELQEKYKCPILSGGDVFHIHNPSLELVSEVISWGVKFVTVAGQHDLPNHNMKNYKRSGLNVLEQAGIATVLSQTKGYTQGIDTMALVDGEGYVVHGFSWNDEPTPLAYKDPDTVYIALIHHFVYQDKNQFVGAEEVGTSAKRLMKKLKGYDVIVSGDNHLPFIERTENQVLINCGSLTRQSASQVDYKPAVWLLMRDTLEPIPMYLPIKEEYCVRDHLQASEDKEQRISAFVESLSDEIEVSLSFEKTVEELLSKNEVKTETKEIIEEAVYG